MASLFSGIGEFIKNNPMIVPTALTMLGAAVKSNARTTDPSLRGRAMGEGYGNVGSLFLKQHLNKGKLDKEDREYQLRKLRAQSEIEKRKFDMQQTKDDQGRKDKFTTAWQQAGQPTPGEPGIGDYQNDDYALAPTPEVPGMTPAERQRDPTLLGLHTRAFGGADLMKQRKPEEWRQTPSGGLEPVPGGSADLGYLSDKAAAIRAPTKPTAPSPLGKLIAEHNALPSDHPQRAIYRQGIAKAVSQSGMRVTVDPSGKITLEQGSALSATARDKLQGENDALSSARENIGTILRSLEKSPGLGGAKGSIKGAAQSGVEIIGDVLGPTARRWADNAAAAVATAFGQGKVDKDVTAFFDPSLPQNEVFENSLAYALARARKGAGRLNGQDILNAKKDVRITGLTSVAEVKARLKAVDAEIARSQGGIGRRLGNKQEANPENMTDAELRKALEQ